MRFSDEANFSILIISHFLCRSAQLHGKQNMTKWHLSGKASKELLRKFQISLTVFVNAFALREKSRIENCWCLELEMKFMVFKVCNMNTSFGILWWMKPPSSFDFQEIKISHDFGCSEGIEICRCFWEGRFF